MRIHEDYYLNKARRWCDSQEKGKGLIMALQYPEAQDRVTYMLEMYPELGNWTHQSLAALVGFQRETVTRVMNKIPEYKKRKKCV